MKWVYFVRWKFDLFCLNAQISNVTCLLNELKKQCLQENTKYIFKRHMYGFVYSKSLHVSRQTSNNNEI